MAAGKIKTDEALLVKVVDRQLSAYNAGDLDKFASCYSDDVQILSDGEGIISGKDELLCAYRKQFEQSPLLRVEISRRVVWAGWVIDCERVNRGGEVLMSVLVLYRVRHGLIDRVHFVPINSSV